MHINKKFKSEALKAIHSTARTLHSVGVINKKTMKDYDALCTKPIDLDPSAIRQIRVANKLTQREFAAYLNVSISTIERWESSHSTPSGAALRLLSVVQKHGIKVLI